MIAHYSPYVWDAIHLGTKHTGVMFALAFIFTLFVAWMLCSRLERIEQRIRELESRTD